MGVTVIPLRLDDRIALEKRLKELYIAQPRQRRMDFIRGLLRLGLGALDDGAQLPGTEVLEIDQTRAASRASVTRTSSPQQLAQSKPPKASPEPLAPVASAPVVVQSANASSDVKCQVLPPVKVQLAAEPLLDEVKASGALKGFFSVSTNN